MREGTVHSRKRNYGRSVKVNVESAHHARLRCGHEVTGFPVASLGTKRFFRCPEGCGLQRALV